MSSIKQLIINAIIKVSVENPALNREDQPTAEEARDMFIASLMEELFPEHGNESSVVEVPVAAPVAERKQTKEEKAAEKAAKLAEKEAAKAAKEAEKAAKAAEKDAAAKAKEEAKAAKEAEKAAKAEAKAVKAASPKKSPEEKAAEKEAEKAKKEAEKAAEKAAKLAEKEAAKAAEKLAKEQAKEAEKAAKEAAKLAEKEAAKLAKEAEKVAAKAAKSPAKAADVPLPASPKPKKATKAPKPVSDANVPKMDPTWRKTLKEADKDRAKELEPELLTYLNAMSKDAFNDKSAREHVAAFLAERTRPTSTETSQVAPVDLEVVEFQGKDYYVNPETKRVYEGVVDAEGNLTVTRPVGYLGMADFKDMTLEDE